MVMLDEHTSEASLGQGEVVVIWLADIVNNENYI